MRLIATVLLGVAGKENSLNHARATGKLLSALDPDHVAALTIIPIPGTPFFEACKSGVIKLPDEKGLLKELDACIKRLLLFFFQSLFEPL
jgi:hypothetical protein